MTTSLLTYLIQYFLRRDQLQDPLTSDLHAGRGLWWCTALKWQKSLFLVTVNHTFLVRTPPGWLAAGRERPAFSVRIRQQLRVSVMPPRHGVQQQPKDHTWVRVAVSLGPDCWPLTQGEIFGIITFLAEKSFCSSLAIAAQCYFRLNSQFIPVWGVHACVAVTSCTGSCRGLGSCFLSPVWGESDLWVTVFWSVARVPPCHF